MSRAITYRLLQLFLMAGYFSVNCLWLLVFTTPDVIAEAAGKGSVARAMFSTEIENRTPLNQVLMLTNQHREVFFFSDLRHFENQKVIHRWEYDGKVVKSKTFEVKGPRWRVYSIMQLSPRQLGTWRVVITNEQGWPFKAAIFKYVDSQQQQDAILPAP